MEYKGLQRNGGETKEYNRPRSKEQGMRTGYANRVCEQSLKSIQFEVPPMQTETKILLYSSKAKFVTLPSVRNKGDMHRKRYSTNACQKICFLAVFGMTLVLQRTDKGATQGRGDWSCVQKGAGGQGRVKENLDNQSTTRMSQL